MPRAKLPEQIERAGGVIAAVLPCQYHQDPPPSGERRLWIAVLESAVDDYVRQGRHLIAFERAKTWFEEAGETDPFAYAVICAALDWDPVEIYAGVRAYRARLWDRPVVLEVPGEEPHAETETAVG